MYRSRFKRFDGEYIPDIIQYIKDCIIADPSITISVGCDSIQKRHRTVYAITIIIYNSELKHGAHVVFFRESCTKIRDNNERLYKEALYLHDVATFLDTELADSYQRKDLTEIERKRYKFHLAKCNQEYPYLPIFMEESAINSMVITPQDRSDFKLVDIHVDFNPFEGSKNERGISKNKSYNAYKSYVPWLRGLGFRTWAKPCAYGASTAADLLLQN